MASLGASLLAVTRALNPLVATTLPVEVLISLAKMSISAAAGPLETSIWNARSSVARAYCPVEALTALTAPEFWKVSIIRARASRGRRAPPAGPPLLGGRLGLGRRP